MSNYQSLQHVFLIAMPQLKDPFFSQAVVYLWEYNEQGATGIVINKPMNLLLGELLEQLDVAATDPRVINYPVLRGGPVAQGQGFIIRRKETRDFDPSSTTPLVEITVSSAKQDLMDLAHGDGLGDSIVALGCSGWAAGQLDKELANNDWLIAPFNESTLFGDSSDNIGQLLTIDKWYTAAASAGIDLSRLSTDVGHA